MTKSWVSEYADGSQQVGLVYSAPGDPADATIKRLFVQMTRTDKPLTLESIFQRPKSPSTGFGSGYYLMGQGSVADFAYGY